MLVTVCVTTSRGLGGRLRKSGSHFAAGAQQGLTTGWRALEVLKTESSKGR